MKRTFTLCALTLALVLASGLAGGAEAWSGKVGWTFKADAPITSSVAVAGNLVLAGDSNGTLYALSRSSGNPVWTCKGTNSVVGTPAVADGRVIFAQGDGTVTCLKLSDGALVWQDRPEVEGGAETMTDGASAGGGRIFLARGDGRLYAQSAADGKTLWTYESKQQLRSAPLFSDGFVFLGEQSALFSALDPKTGRRVWGGGAGGAVNTPAAADGSVYFSSWDGSVHKVKIRGVVPQWDATLGSPVTTAPVPGAGRVYVGTAAGGVFALSQKNGSTLWQFDTKGGNVTACPVFAEGLVFVGGGQGVLSVLDAATGALRFTFSTNGGINGSPAFSGGVLYLGSSDGHVYALI